MPSQNNPHNVSSREFQILHLAAEGQTDKEIAAQLGISRDTVGTYWKRIRRRLGGSSRTEAVARALRQEASDAINQYVVEHERLLYEVAERIRLEEERAKLIVRLETLIDGLHSGILLEDDERKVIYLNRAMLELMGSNGNVRDVVGSDGAVLTDSMDRLFLPETRFSERTQALVARGEKTLGEELRLVCGAVFERDYTPLRSKRGLDGHLWQYRNITALRTAMDTLETKSAFDDLIATLSTEVLSSGPSTIDATIVRALEAVGRHRQADRVYVMLLSPDDKILSVTHEWLRQGVSSTFQHLTNLDVSQLGPSMDLLRAGKHVAVDAVRRAPNPSPTERRLLEETGTQSILAVPLIVEGRMRGCLSFAHVREARPWTDAEIALLRLVAVTIGHALARSEQLRS